MYLIISMYSYTIYIYYHDAMPWPRFRDRFNYHNIYYVHSIDLKQMWSCRYFNILL